MELSRIVAATFSATGSTRVVISTLLETLQEETGLVAERHDLTPYGSVPPHDLGPSDLLVVACPCFNGRVPAPFASTLAKMHAMFTPAVLVMTYGNRAIDDGLAELKDLALKAGLTPVAAMSVVCQHSLFGSVANGRPNGTDLLWLDDTAIAVADKITSAQSLGDLTQPEVPGCVPTGSIAKARIKPSVDAQRCCRCYACAGTCPTGSISFDDPTRTGPACIGCMACTHVCPTAARYLDTRALATKERTFAQDNAAAQKPQLWL